MINTTNFLVNRRSLIAGSLAASVLPVSGYCEETTPAGRSAPEQVKEMQTWAHSLALQAATYGAPIVAMYLLRDSTSFGSQPKAPPNEIWRITDIATPTIAQEAGYVTPNVNVVYGFGFMDLAREPIILTVPDSNDRYYMVEIVDMWTNAFAYAGGTATGYKGGKFALVGPGWNGELPRDAKRIDAPTRWIELQPRVHVKNSADLAGAEAVLQAITVQSLGQYKGGAAPAPVAYDYLSPKINPKVASSQMQFLDPLQFWEVFSTAMNENPPPEDEIKAVIPVFKYLGLELGRQWKRESVPPLVLQQMQAAAQQIGPMMNRSLLAGKLANGWLIPPANIGMAGKDYLSRAIVAVFGLTANTPAEAMYYSGVLDGAGQPLTGAKRYTINFTSPMHYLEPVPPGFWSVTMYDGVTRFTVPNPIDRYSLGSDDDLKKNADGSFTIYVQSDSPGQDRETNWLPAPSGPFYLILRNYAPVPEAVEALQNPATFQGPPPVMPT